MILRVRRGQRNPIRERRGANRCIHLNAEPTTGLWYVHTPMSLLVPRLSLALAILLPCIAAGQTWEPVPLVTAAARQAGSRGGEGCQWPQAIAVDAAQGNFLLFGTDVGGIFRSLDGGATWQPANDGLNARGACGFAIDPHNPRRALLVAGNSMAAGFHGVYLTTDQAASWRNVLPFDNKGYRDVRAQIVFDPSSFDVKAGCTRVAYWSAAATPSRPGGLFKSEDGGIHWKELTDTRAYGGSELRVHPQKGWVYVGNSDGFFVSRDGGATFQRTLAEGVEGLDTASGQTDAVFALTEKGVFTSGDGGQNFRAVPATALPPLKVASTYGRMSHFAVSPADPQRMLASNDEGDWNWQKYVSRDGGATWRQCVMDTARSFFANDNRPNAYVWHPREPNVAWAFGGDFVTRSTDGGLTWNVANDGNNGIMVGHSFSFNARNSDLIYLPSQDYDGALSADGGYNWRRAGLSGQDWGGWTYGGYAVSDQFYFGGRRRGGGDDDPRTLVLTRDGGRTLIDTGLRFQGPEVCGGDPGDARVLFASNYRSGDAGNTWQPMNGCDAVFTACPGIAGTFYGGKGGAVVVSRDHGATWEPVATLPDGNGVRDVACGVPGRQLYVVAEGSQRLFTVDLTKREVADITDRLVADQMEQRGAWSVAVDPVDPRVVYVVRPGNYYLSDASVCRSVDGGRTWTSLTRSVRLPDALPRGPDGGREAMWVRVHPKTRFAFVATNCFGLWKIGPPDR